MDNLGVEPVAGRELLPLARLSIAKHYLMAHSFLAISCRSWQTAVFSAKNSCHSDQQPPLLPLPLNCLLMYNKNFGPVLRSWKLFLLLITKSFFCAFRQQKSDHTEFFRVYSVSWFRLMAGLWRAVVLPSLLTVCTVLLSIRVHCTPLQNVH